MAYCGNLTSSLYEILYRKNRSVCRAYPLNESTNCKYLKLISGGKRDSDVCTGKGTCQVPIFLESTNTVICYIHHYPPKNPKLRHLVPVKPLLSRVSSLHFQKHQAFLRSASIWVLETEALLKLQMLLKHRPMCHFIYCMYFFPSQDKYIAVDVLSLTKIVTI